MQVAAPPGLFWIISDLSTAFFRAVGNTTQGVRLPDISYSQTSKTSFDNCSSDK